MNTKNILYGDGIHDDYPAIQEVLDSRQTCVYLPAPKKNYVISKCLKIHSNQEFRLDRYTVIRLIYNANCAMMENADPEGIDENICISGGICDMNHNAQHPNPFHFDNPETGEKAAESAWQTDWFSQGRSAGRTRPRWSASGSRLTPAPGWTLPSDRPAQPPG